MKINFLGSSMKDDLESLVYTIIFLYTGNLPWGVQTKQND